MKSVKKRKLYIKRAWQQKLYTKFLEAMSMTTKQSEERSNVIKI